MTDLHQTEVDGVRCFWVETGRPTLAARLVFRQGIADEPVIESGWQHLLEHMALEGLGGGALSVNGAVTLLETVFDAHGPADAVAETIRDLTARLAAPTFSSIDRERSVLRAEGDVRGDGPVSRALVQRYGAAGPGVSQYSEPGMGRATPELLAARAARVFTQGNAALVLDGSPPSSLTLQLSDGPLLGFAQAVPCGDRLPAMYVENAGLVVSGVVDRSIATGLAAELLKKRITDQWRHQDGLAYAPWSVYERVDADRAVILAGTDMRPEGLAKVADGALLLVRRLRSRVPEAEQIDELKTARLQALRDPYAAIGVAIRGAHEALQGRPPLTLEEMLAEVEAVTTYEVRSAFAQFQDTLLLGIPGKATWTKQIPTLKVATNAPRIHGSSHRSVDWPADASRLVIGDDGPRHGSEGRDHAVELQQGRTARTVPASTLAAVLCWQDGRRYLLQRDGYGLLVDPRDWHGGPNAVATIDALVPESQRLPMTGEVDPDGRKRLSFGRRWWLATSAPVGRALTKAGALSLVFMLVTLFLLVAVGLALHAGRIDALSSAGVAIVFCVSMSIRFFGRS